MGGARAGDGRAGGRVASALSTSWAFVAALDLDERGPPDAVVHTSGYNYIVTCLLRLAAHAPCVDRAVPCMHITAPSATNITSHRKMTGRPLLRTALLAPARPTLMSVGLDPPRVVRTVITTLWSYARSQAI